MCSCINSSHSPTPKLLSETCNDSSNKSSLLTFILALFVTPSASSISSISDSATGSLVWRVARSSEENKTQDGCWHPQFTLHLTPNNYAVIKLKRPREQHNGKFQRSMASSLKSLLELFFFVVGFIIQRSRELCKQICLVSVSVAKFPSCGTNFK